MLTFPTNLLALPLLQMVIETGTNEDWVDSIKYVVDDGSGDIDNFPQCDLSGIRFDMEVRRAVGDHEVVLSASSATGGLAIGADPDFGFLLINIDHALMLTKSPGDYVADIVGSDAFSTRRCATIDLKIVHGVTRP